MYDKASLALIPSGYKGGSPNGTLYSVLPANGDGDFDHTRATSATRVNKDGLIESVASGVPRLDYPLIDGVVQDCPALLLEPSRTNLVTYSEDFSDASWTTSNTSVSSNQTTSPDGSVNADKLTDNATSNVHRIRDAVSLSASTDYSLSVFAKKDTLSNIQLALINTGNSHTISKVFDLENGTLGEELSGGGTTVSDAKIENFGNGWYRCTIVGQLGSTPNQYQISLATKTTGNSHTLNQVTYSGDGTGSVFLYGAQIEEGSYATSYIPTTSSTVTRNADECNGAGTSAEFNDSEGVFFAEIASLGAGSVRRFAIDNNASPINIVRLEYSSTTNRFFGVIYNGTSQIALSTYLTDELEFNKVAFKYKSGDFALWVNGVEVATSTSTFTMPSGLKTLGFDDGSGGNKFYSKSKQVMVFNEALTDAELATLTS